MTAQAQKAVNISIEELLNFSEQYTDRMEQLRQEEAAEKKKPEKELVLWTAIAGIQHHLDPNSRKGRKFLKSLEPGTTLILRREPDNKHDRWAIAVETEDGQMLGYITRYKNETIARMMDHGHLFEAQVESAKHEETKESEQQKTYTEQFLLPFSVWLVK